MDLSFINLPGFFRIHLHFWHLQSPMARSFRAYSCCLLLVWGWLLTKSTLFPLVLSLKNSSTQLILSQPGFPPPLPPPFGFLGLQYE